MSISIGFEPDQTPSTNHELEINRRNTLAFIDADPLVLVLLPRDKVRGGDGGFSFVDGTPRDAQTLRLIPQSDVMPTVQNPDGFTLTPTYVLLGPHDCVMGRWDRFLINGVTFQIVSPIRPDYTLENVFERKADVARV